MNCRIDGELCASVKVLIIILGRIKRIILNDNLLFVHIQISDIYVVIHYTVDYRTVYLSTSKIHVYKIMS